LKLLEIGNPQKIGNNSKLEILGEIISKCLGMERMVDIIDYVHLQEKFKVQ
jgi:hypothetical protein